MRQVLDDCFVKTAAVCLSPLFLVNQVILSCVIETRAGIRLHDLVPLFFDNTTSFTLTTLDRTVKENSDLLDFGRSVLDATSDVLCHTTRPVRCS